MGQSKSSQISAKEKKQAKAGVKKQKSSRPPGLKILSPNDIQASELTQTRVKTDQTTVESYIEVLRNGGKLPPVTVCWDVQAQCNWMANGYHRLAAWEAVGVRDIPAIVIEGNERDAFLLSIKENSKNGLPYSNEDKRQIVDRLLRDEEWGNKSSREIAKMLRCVSPRFVDGRKEELGLSANGSQIEVNRGDQKYLIKKPIKPEAKVQQLAPVRPVEATVDTAHPDNVGDVRKTNEIDVPTRPPSLAVDGDDIGKSAIVTPADVEAAVLHCSDIESVESMVPTDSLDLIFTDPPYDGESVELFSVLGRFAQRTLKPGGSLLVMTGQYHLPQFFEKLTAGLTYHWTMAYVQSGPEKAIYQRKIGSKWKPILWFVKGVFDGNSGSDVFMGGGRDKDYHERGQSLDSVRALIERFTAPGDLVCDPFVGGGTTAVAAIQIGRKFIGIDKDPVCISTTRQRLNELKPSANSFVSTSQPPEAERSSNPITPEVMK